MTLTNRLLRKTPSRDARRRTPHLELVHTPRVLVVLQLDRMASSLRAVRRGRTIARRRGAELTFLVVRHPSVERSTPPTKAARERGDRGSSVLGTVDWLMARSGELAGGHVLVRTGYPTEVTSEVAAGGRYTLIVVGAARTSGGQWARVAGRTRVPVLVARRGRESRVIVAATDYTDQRFPTFETAVTMAARRRGEVLLVHNVDPQGLVFTRRGGFALSANAVQKLRDVRAEQLHELALAAPIDAHALVTGNEDPTSAIVEQSRRRDADIVVVGAHAPSERSVARRRTANALIERLNRSVLVVPLSGPRYGV